jgi:hypothetical protein
MGINLKIFLFVSTDSFPPHRTKKKRVRDANRSFTVGDTHACNFPLLKQKNLNSLHVHNKRRQGACYIACRYYKRIWRVLFTNWTESFLFLPNNRPSIWFFFFPGKKKGECNTLYGKCINGNKRCRYIHTQREAIRYPRGFEWPLYLFPLFQTLKVFFLSG